MTVIRAKENWVIARKFLSKAYQSGIRSCVLEGQPSQKILQRIRSQFSDLLLAAYSGSSMKQTMNLVQDGCGMLLLKRVSLKRLFLLRRELENRGYSHVVLCVMIETDANMEKNGRIQQELFQLQDLGIDCFMLRGNLFNLNCITWMSKNIKVPVGVVLEDAYQSMMKHADRLKWVEMEGVHWEHLKAVKRAGAHFIVLPANTTQSYFRLMNK